jgi:hypothetical protein
MQCVIFNMQSIFLLMRHYIYTFDTQSLTSGVYLTQHILITITFQMLKSCMWPDSRAWKIEERNISNLTLIKFLPPTLCQSGNAVLPKISYADIFK